MHPSSFWLRTIFPFSEHICVPARFRISNCAKTHTQWPTKHHVQMWPDQARGLCGWRCIPVIVMCVCVSGPAAGVCLSLVCVTRDTDRRLRLVDARVLWPWEIYGFVNSGSQRALLGPDQRMCSSCVRFPHSLVKVWVCIIFPSLLMTFTVSVKCCRFMMPLFRFLWTWKWEVTVVDCYILTIKRTE